ncbi:MAG: TetR/AcrR family transcriptional regulator [Leptospiraceae bacterium]|nr:TetR/AcrR family transcriptional regulator [Leptospiraceae bacterium]
MGVREQQKATNRQSIAQAALETFIEIGYEACTIRDIVRYSGLSPGTFYNYFESKEDVLDFILQDLAIRVRQTVRRERARATSGRDFIYQGFFAFLEEVGREPAILRMLSRNQTVFRNLVFGNAGALPPTADSVVALGGIDSSEQKDTRAATTVQGIFEDLGEDLNRAVETGHLPTMPATLVSMAMVGAGFEVLVRMSLDSSLTADGAARFLTDLFLGGLPGLDGRGYHSQE